MSIVSDKIRSPYGSLKGSLKDMKLIHSGQKKKKTWQELKAEIKQFKRED